MQDPGSGIGTALHKIESGVYGKSGTGSFASGYSFNMTAGDVGGAIQGFSNSADNPIGSAFGSIDAEPIDGTNFLRTTYTISAASYAGEVRFEGDIVSTLTGLQIYVDSVLYPFDTDWYNDAGETVGEWASGGPQFTDTVVYFIEIK